jgi:stage III sporulation protein AG
METVLATEKTITETNGGKEVVESPIIINGKTVVLKELYPKINGVVIVAEGANNITVMRKIQQATTSLLGVDLGRIEILTMK